MSDDLPRIRWRDAAPSDSGRAGPPDPPAGGRPPERGAPPPRPLRVLPPTPTLDTLGRDLTALARRGAFDHLAVRDDLLLRLARALLRRERANPVLLGEPGVGKTALVEALARRVAQGGLDPRLAGLRIVELPVAALVGGTVFRGQLEQRVLDVVAELRRRPDVVLFLDELHLLVGAGEGSGGVDVADILKPALARGEIRCVGATTSREYETIVRRDPALERRLSPIRVEEPTPEEALDLLRQLGPGVAGHYGLTVTDEALVAAVNLSVSHLTDRRLPDKAFDLLDDACTHALLPSLAGGGGPGEVTAETVAAALADRTGTRPALLRPRDGDPAAVDVAPILRERVVGQEAAVAALAGAVTLARLGLRPGDRPRGVFLLGGPSGVGKSALARALAVALEGDERGLLRIDLSEFQAPHSVARLTGSPPGYVGHDEGGQLTRFLRERPGGVVLLDEIEKAHPRVLDLFLQVFDAGRITDGRGETIDARHAWFVLTTNLPLDPDEAEADAPSLRDWLRPEFLNRVDRVVPLAPLAFEALVGIARREIDTLAASAGVAGRGLSLVADPHVLVSLARDEPDGTAANGRTVQRRAQQEAAAALAAALADAPPAGSTLRLVLRGGEVRAVVEGG